ncbi:hypothetical protein [Ktedonobacter racemifer]|jgi:hypothetical protein|uniref:Uncharacterized protein n=1 Tax=Ktedonobacter racemifer DSM 44963 TaxID=485913 RepID=D6TNG8_KTERA|nr:hypothetical protein [Ktedonobacter racemifer]EFH87299.1 hypothetical protein Krac_8629 [Ktedonobacter racemifer DSM 44963]
MKTFRTLFLEICLQMKWLANTHHTARMQRTMIQQKIGRLCYQAEKDLQVLDVSLLKDLLNVQEDDWSVYKQIYRDGLFMRIGENMQPV